MKAERIPKHSDIDSIFRQCENAGGRPLGEYHRALMLQLIESEEPRTRLPRPTSRQQEKTWRAIERHLSSAVELIDGDIGQAMACRQTLCTFAGYRAQGLFPIGNPTPMLGHGLGWDNWWRDVRGLLLCIVDSARHNADRVGESKRQRDETKDNTIEILQNIYYDAGTDFRAQQNREPPNRFPAFLRAVGKHLPRHLRSASAETFAARPRQKRRANKKPASKDRRAVRSSA